MPSAAVAAAFNGRLEDEWDGDVYSEQQTEPPAEAEKFLIVQYPVVNGSKPVLGRTFFEDGAARLVLQVRREVGLTQGLEWADELAAIFREVKFDGVQAFTPNAPIINDSVDDGNWLELSVVVPYRYEFNG